MNTTRSDRRFTHYARLGVEAMADELRRVLSKEHHGFVDKIAERASSA